MFEFGRENPILIWLPVVELDFGQERFLTDDPTKLFSLGKFARVPVIAGVTKYELLFPAISEYSLFRSLQVYLWQILSAVIKDQTLRQEMDANFTGVAPICFMYDRNSDHSAQISTELRRRFLPGPILDDESLPQLNNVNCIETLINRLD